MSGNRSSSFLKRASFSQDAPSFWGNLSCHQKLGISLLVGIGFALGLNPPAQGESPPTVTACSCSAAQPSWIFQPAQFSHAPGTDQRVVQYQAPPPAVVPGDPTYQESGYRHKRSGISVRGSFDYRHVVETWGAGESIRPYGEWLYPFRPGATPFGPWGNPQGPWTLPFQSWQNPYGAWNRYGYPYGMVPLPVWPPPTVAPPAP